jgi:diguanylate cyclase (GGDEF)-like protein
MSVFTDPRPKRAGRIRVSRPVATGRTADGRPRAFVPFCSAVVVAGIASLGAVDEGWHHVRSSPWTAGVLAALLLVTELMPVVLLRRRDKVAVATSTTFTLALLLFAGIGPALVAQLVASLVADILHRKGSLKVAFNLAQFAIAVVASGWVLSAFGRHPILTDGLLRPDDIGVAAAAACTFLLVNNLLVWTVVSLATSSSLRRRIKDEWLFATATSLLLIGLAPVIAFVAVKAIAMLPLLLIPVGGIYITGRSSVAQAYQAVHDGLTGLTNRTGFQAEVRETLAEAAPTGRPLALFIIDLDHFKEINDTLGHHAGDQLLCEVGPRLAASSPEVSLVARLGGDEFAVLLDHISGPAQAIEVAGALTLGLEKPFVLPDGLLVELEASIGVVVTPEHGEDVDILLQRADVAMYLAKASRTGIELYAPERDDNTRRRLTLVGQLRTAIANNELTLFYQPKLDLATGDFFAVEALIRWPHPELGNVTPDEFIPLAERSGLIKPLTRFVLETAINQAQLWRRAGLPLRMAVNLSARSLLDDELPATVAFLLAEAGMDPATLELEITETQLMADPIGGAKVLGRLHAMGVRLTIDDFGTGYSSLSYLSSLPVDEIKIDRCFVSTLAPDGGSNDDIIVRSTIDLARNLGLEVTAEGVETSEQMQRLSVLGCHFLQGFYLSRPVPAPELYTFLAPSPTYAPSGLRHDGRG